MIKTANHLIDFINNGLMYFMKVLSFFFLKPINMRGELGSFSINSLSQYFLFSLKKTFFKRFISNSIFRAIKNRIRSAVLNLTKRGNR